MCSRGQILLEIPDAIAMVTQNWVGKNAMCSRGSPWDLYKHSNNLLKAHYSFKFLVSKSQKSLRWVVVV